jgi:hypothetical protein
MDLKTLEAKAEKALVFLHEKAGEHAEARAQADHLSDWVKVEKSRVMGLYTALSAAAAEAEASRLREGAGGSPNSSQTLVRDSVQAGSGKGFH